MYGKLFIIWLYFDNSKCNVHNGLREATTKMASKCFLLGLKKKIFSGKMFITLQSGLMGVSDVLNSIQIVKGG